MEAFSTDARILSRRFFAATLVLTMTVYHTLHVLALGLWAGLVATEAVVELMGRSNQDLQGAATWMHYRVDMFVELPILVLVLFSGLLLIAATDPLTSLHLAKVSCGLAAICVNLYCVVLVIQRNGALARGDSALACQSRTRRILLCFLLGGAFAAVAGALGICLVALRAAS